MTNPKNKINMILQMMQACKNIMSATSGVLTPEDFDKQDFVMENVEMCLTIILETYGELSRNEDDKLEFIHCEDLSKYAGILKLNKSQIDKAQLLYTCKNEIPCLKEKIENFAEKYRISQDR